MAFPRPSDTDRDRFRALVPDDSRVEIKPMFGQLGAFVDGNMFLGLFGADVGVKLAADDRGRLLAEGGSPFGPEERPMPGYVTLPSAWHEEPERVHSWVRLAFDQAAALPPKAGKR
ncbi:MAG: TfoX/Sxy family protein [Actinobacteria bacterium]|nr:TfoX/Sxy family protein [Actinomycetota bacterium]